ncbi:MAG: AAA family ATPase [Dehalococcoidia bacterium]|nr:AAA family ATPase [Dehalococcoidia bacterium]
MKLTCARVQNYRSVRDTGWFSIEQAKTILVGPNEAGKTAVLEALQQINPPDGVRRFNPLRDYPRKLYNADIQSQKREPSEIPVASPRFDLDTHDLAALPDGFSATAYCCTRYLDNNAEHWLEGGPEEVVFSENIRKDLMRLVAHVDRNVDEGQQESTLGFRADINDIIGDWQVGTTKICDDRAVELRNWLDAVLEFVDGNDEVQDERHTRLLRYTRISEELDSALAELDTRLPIFVYFNNYFRVRPNLHLRHFADRIEQNLLDDDRYDYGNLCLLKLLGFNPRELANLGDAPDPGDDQEAFERYRSQLDERSIKLNAASVRLTSEILSIWNPDLSRGEADTVLIQADGQYLKVVVQDELGVQIEVDQRSAGFQWLVSFFVVFFAEADDTHANAILLLDEPGLSLHGLKQREFRQTISRLAESNQTIYTTHSPFLVGPDELDLVRVVEMTDRNDGTMVHTSVTARDPAALLPLQEALGYDLAQSLFIQQRNFILEGLTDSWYFDATAQLLRDARLVNLNQQIALLSANAAGKVVYFATILHANNLKVAALLDSDNAGDQAAKQETLVNTLGNRNIIRTGDVCPDAIAKSEIEDLLRNTLVEIARSELGWDVTEVADKQPQRPIADIFAAEINDFSKYRLAKAYIRWTREHSASDLTESERSSWVKLIKRVNQALR